MRDRQFLLLAYKLENATEAELNYLIQSIQYTVNKFTRGGQITDPVALNQAINKLIDTFYKRYVEQLRTSGEAVGALRAEQAIKTVLPLLRKAGLFQQAASLYKDIQNYSADVKKRMMYDTWAGQPLGYRIKTIKEGTQKTVQNIITNAMSDGKSAKDVAKMIEQYIKPTSSKVRPFDEYRKRFGRPKSFTPKGVPAGSVQFNAMRIARTEMSHIARTATLDFYENREWVTGYSWNLSNRHPEYDICDEYASKTYDTRNDVPEPHPQCLCDVLPILMPYEDMIKMNTKKYTKEKARV